MDITTIDKNFKQKEVEKTTTNTYRLPCENVKIYGAYYDENYGFIKMPMDLAYSINGSVAWGMRCTAGVRATFSTDSKSLTVNAKIYSKCLMPHMAIEGSAGFTINEITKNGEKYISNFYPDFTENDNFSVKCNLPGKKMRNYVLYFPLYSGVIEMSLEIDKRSTLSAYEYYKDVKPILYYGSSITQGGCASKPNNCYQALIGEKYNIDYKILGISGNAKGEPAMAEFIANEDCSVFVCDYDYNAPNVEHLRKTHLPLYKAFRSNPKNKTTPVIFISKPDGYIGGDSADRIKVILDTYNYAKQNGDENVYFIDGRTFYPSKIRSHCDIDGCHPTDLGFYYMFKVIDKTLSKIDIK